MRSCRLERTAAIKVIGLWMAARRLHDLSALWYFLHLKKRRICWLRWFIFARGDLIKAFLMQCVINGQCRLQRESDSRVKLWLFWATKKSCLNYFLIALLYHFYVGILGNIPALQVRAFLRQQVAKTNKKKDLMSSPKSHLYSVPILDGMSWFYFQCNTDFTFLETIYLTSISEFTGT